MAIREALGEAKAKERTVEVQTFVKKYLADAVEMKRGRDLGTHGFEHQELYLFPRESFARTASAYAEARTANAIDDPAERDAAEAEAPKAFDGGNAAEDDRDGDALVRRRERTAVASIVHRAPVKTKGATVKAPDPARDPPDPGPLSKRPRTAGDASAYCAICDCTLTSRDGTLWRVHVEGARHRANLAATRRTSPQPPSRAAADAVSINRASPVARRSTRAGISSAADHPAPRFAPTTASAWADRVAGLADELLDARARAARRDRALGTGRKLRRSERQRVLEDLKREAEAERRCGPNARGRRRNARNARKPRNLPRSDARSSPRRVAERSPTICRGSNPIEEVAEEETNRRGTRRSAPRCVGALESELAASHVRLRAKEAPVGIAAAAGAPRVAGGGTPPGFAFPAWTNRPRQRRAAAEARARPSVACARRIPNERVRYMFVGCQHVCVCGECADVIWKQGPNKRACPICREKVKHRAIPFRARPLVRSRSRFGAWPVSERARRRRVARRGCTV